MLAITPATLIYTAFEANAYQYIFEIGGVYIITAVLTLFVYSGRLYTNRSVLAAVGKSWIPVEDGEVSKNVRKMIKTCLSRSAVIAWESRPRDLQQEMARVDSDHSGYEKTAGVHVGTIIKVDPELPPWGHVRHSGWSSPSQADTLTAPHIQFRSVVHELPNLIEAKAVSLAPPHPNFTFSLNEPVLAAGRLVDLLQRHQTHDLRTYLAHLSSLGVIEPPHAGDDFLARYDRARFCTVPISEPEFNALMASFAELLGAMQQLPPDVITAALNLATDSPGSDQSSITSSRAPSISSSIAASQAHLMPPGSRMGSRLPSFAASWHSARSASVNSPTPTNPRPRTAQTQMTDTSLYKTPSQGSFRSVLRAAASQETFGSVGSILRPARSLGFDGSSLSSGSSGLSSARSVIRLASSPGPGRLPYEWVDQGG